MELCAMLCSGSGGSVVLCGLQYKSSKLKMLLFEKINKNAGFRFWRAAFLYHLGSRTLGTIHMIQ